MERFSEQTASDLAHNYARSRFAEEIFESVPTCECLKCDGCGAEVPASELAMVDDGTDSPLFCCPTCKAKAEQPEPDCTCELSGDMADASGCPLHGPTRPSVFIEAGCTPAEAAAFQQIARKAARIERMQGELFPSEVA